MRASHAQEVFFLNVLALGSKPWMCADNFYVFFSVHSVRHSPFFSSGDISQPSKCFFAFKRVTSRRAIKNANFDGRQPVVLANS